MRHSSDAPIPPPAIRISSDPGAAQPAQLPMNDATNPLANLVVGPTAAGGGDGDDGQGARSNNNSNNSLASSSGLDPCSPSAIPSSASASGPEAATRTSKARRPMSEQEKAQHLERRKQRQLSALGFSNPGRAFQPDISNGAGTNSSSSTNTGRRSSRRRSSALPQTQSPSGSHPSVTPLSPPQPPLPPKTTTTTTSRRSSPLTAEESAPTVPRSPTLPTTSTRPTKRARTNASGPSRSRKSQVAEAEVANGTLSGTSGLDKGKSRAKEPAELGVPARSTTSKPIARQPKSTPVTTASSKEAVPRRRRSGLSRRASGSVGTTQQTSTTSSSPAPPSPPPPPPSDDVLPSTKRKRPSKQAIAPEAVPSTDVSRRPSTFIAPDSEEGVTLIEWYRDRHSIQPVSEWRPTSPAHLPREYAALMEARATWAQAAVVGNQDSLQLSVPLSQLHGPIPPIPLESDAQTVQVRLRRSLWESSPCLEEDGGDCSPHELDQLARYQGEVLARIDSLRHDGSFLADYLPYPDALTPQDSGMGSTTFPVPSTSLGQGDRTPLGSNASAATPTPVPLPRDDVRIFTSYLQAIAPPVRSKPDQDSKTPWTELVNSIPARSRASATSTEAHLRGTRRVAKMVTQHWERVAARAERERKGEERRVKSLARWTGKQVMKQWRLAITVVHKRKADVARAAEEQRGREQLSQILRQSTQMLEARQRGLTWGHTTEFVYHDNPGNHGAIEEEVEEEQEPTDDEQEGVVDDLSDFSMDEAPLPRPAAQQENQSGSEEDGVGTGYSLLAGLYADDVPSPTTLPTEPGETTPAQKDDSPLTAVPDALQLQPRSGVATPSVSARRISRHLVHANNEDQKADADSFGDEPLSDDDGSLQDENADDQDEDDDLLATADVPLEELLKKYPGYKPNTPAVTTPIAPTAPSPNASFATADDQHSPVPDADHQSEPAVDVSSPTSSSGHFLSPVPEPQLEAQDAEADRMMSENGYNGGGGGGDSDEDAGLLADADLSLEELLRKYHQPSDDSDLSSLTSIEQNEEAAPYERNLTRDLLEPSPSSTGEIKVWSDDESELTDEDDQGARFNLLNTTQPNGKGKRLIEEVPDEIGLVQGQPEGQLLTVSSSSPNSAPGPPDVTTSEVPSYSEKPEPRIHPPFLLRGTLRSYQQNGLEWLADLYCNGMNGILADEMGLGKTIQTIALLAHLACDRGIWGPHLVIAPTSVMLNWEMEFKKFLPGFKILSYYGNQRERKEKRVGWQKENAFNVCITSYQLVLADQHIFRRKAWMYMILDEAHHIKNFRAKRWQTLLGFHSQRRLLLTGTPLQNNLMDLWSLMYFLMPHGIDEATGGGAFSSIKDFQDWFANPLDKAIQGGEAVNAETRDMVSKLHTVLRPFILRRLKSEVEQELPHKYEHVITCRLSKRQRFLYNDFMSRAATRQSLASGNYLSIINCLMQLRKVCNHPDLFEVRPIVTSFAMDKAVAAEYEIKNLLIRRSLVADQDDIALAERERALNLGFISPRDQHAVEDLAVLDASSSLEPAGEPGESAAQPSVLNTSSISAYRQSLTVYHEAQYAQRWARHQVLNRERCHAIPPVYSNELLNSVRSIGQDNHLLPFSVADQNRKSHMERCDAALEAVLPYSERMQQGSDIVDRFAFATPAVYAPQMAELALPGLDPAQNPELQQHERDILHNAAVKLQIAFPDKSLLQYDCGKLQQLDLLMRRLKDGGHRILIFTQMTKVLDILESFLSFHGYRYLRLDGATKVEDRQLLTERFNRDARITAFILSTRSGGLGINLTGADTVLFYDLDWNAAIEQQCMDRAHRIGQTRDVHIYRFVSEYTIEENMLKKANQKRLLDTMVIQQGEFSTDSLLRSDWRDMLDDGGRTLAGVRVEDEAAETSSDTGRGRDIERAMLAAEDEEDRAAAHAARQEMMADLSDWGNETTQARAGTAPETPGAVSQDQDEPGQEGREEEEEEEEGTVDDYMLRWVELDWEFFSNV